MKIEKFTFSPTGGTQKVADVLAEALSESDEVVEHDLTNPLLNTSDVTVDEAALCVIAMPCFGGRVPAVAMERLAGIDGRGAKCVVAIVYGNRAYDDALLELKEGAEEAGFEVIAAISAIAEHSIMHQFATDEPGAAEKKELTVFAERIIAKVKGGDCDDVLSVPGNKPYKKAGAAPLVPKVTGNCISCGRCAEGCPVAAINPADYVADKDTCISCMRCIQICGQNARSISKAMVKVASLAIKKECSKEKAPELFI